MSGTFSKFRFCDMRENDIKCRAALKMHHHVNSTVRYVQQESSREVMLLSHTSSCQRDWNRWLGADLSVDVWILRYLMPRPGMLELADAGERGIGPQCDVTVQHGPMFFCSCFNRAQIAVLKTGLFCVLMTNGRRVIMTCRLCGGVDNGSIGYSQGSFQVSTMQVRTRIRRKAIKQVGQLSV